MAERTETAARETYHERLRKMVSLCDDQLRMHPEDLESLLKIAQCLWDMKKGNLALDYLRRALTHHPGDQRIREMLQMYSGEFAFGDQPPSGLGLPTPRERRR